MEDTRFLLALQFLPGLKKRTLLALFQAGFKPKEIWTCTASVKQYLRADRAQQFARLIDSHGTTVEQKAHQTAVDLREKQIRVFQFGAEDYPELLAQINDPPPLLYVRGKVEILGYPQIAIVGSRSASRSGCQLAYETAYELASGGFAITSGLALGIDGAAHRGALDAAGNTLAVVGTGLDQTYPSRHTQLAEQIVVSGGVLVSEFPPGEPPKREHFPQRNRVISGLSVATLVVEAKARSGSLITARLAAEQGRSVCVFPGGIRDPLKKGCHRLIREGALLVENCDDIVESASDLLGHLAHKALATSAGQSKISKEATEEKSHLLNALSTNPQTFDCLLQITQLSARELSVELGKLELAGKVYRSAEGYRRI